MENDIITSSQKVRQKFDGALRFRFGENAKVENLIIGIRFTKYILNLPASELDELNSYKSEFAVLTEKCSNVEFCVEDEKICIYVQNEDFSEKNVSFKEMISSKDYDNFNGILTFPVGKDFNGKTVIADLRNLGCLLCAGFVGSGVSEITENMILSFTSKYNADDFKLILIEPKNYNLKTFDIFQGLPHLLGSKVFKEPDEIMKTFNEVISEINRRNEVLSNFGAPTVEAYNSSQAVKSGKIGGIPYVVVMINKFENVISIDQQKVERFIQILTAKARSCGVYLVMCTEKTTTDVLTNVVMRHIHSKIVFKTKIVSSKYISILPEALNLFPHGDMYLLPFGAKNPMRLQYPFIDFNECKEMVANIVSKSKK